MREIASLSASFVGRFLHNLHARHVAQDLLSRDNHVLTDIGLTRGDVEHATHLRISADAIDELVIARSHHFEDVEQSCRWNDSETESSMKGTLPSMSVIPCKSLEPPRGASAQHEQPQTAAT
jgi:uncharacterized protein YjiS (DUF1127 family)